jgi:hypothetical protein
MFGTEIPRVLFEEYQQGAEDVDTSANDGQNIAVVFPTEMSSATYHIRLTVKTNSTAKAYTAWCSAQSMTGMTLQLREIDSTTVSATMTQDAVLYWQVWVLQ